VLQRSGEGRGRKASDQGEGDSEDAFRFVLSRDDLSTCSSTISNCRTSPNGSSLKPKARGSPGRLLDLRLSREHFGEPYGAARDGPADRVSDNRGSGVDFDDASAVTCRSLDVPLGEHPFPECSPFGRRAYPQLSAACGVVFCAGSVASTLMRHQGRNFAAIP
jgi:hypothetical protein